LWQRYEWNACQLHARCPSDTTSLSLAPPQDCKDAQCPFVVPHCTKANEIPKLQKYWRACCFDSASDCAAGEWAFSVLPGQHFQLTLLACCSSLATIVFVSNVFQAGKPAWIHSADNLQINAKSCEEQCLSIDKCLWGTYFEDGARAMQCWLAEETTSQPMPCGASGSSTSGELMQCVSFHKVGDSGISRHRTTAEPVATLVKQPVIGVLPCCLL